jgi:hypothetical protein
MQKMFVIHYYINMQILDSYLHTKSKKIWLFLLWCSELDEIFQKFCLTCVHIILRLRNFRMAAVATRKREKFKVLGPWLPWQRPPFWICSTPQKLPHTTVDILTKFHEVWWKESKKCFNPPFFVSMATAAKFVQPIPIFLVYLFLGDALIKLYETL